MAGTAAIAVGAVLRLVIRATNAADKRIRDEWDAAARAIGIRRPDPGLFQENHGLQGMVGGLEVSVKARKGKNAFTAYDIGVPFSSLRITAEGMASALGKLVVGEDTHTGDAVFDQKALVRGDPHEILATFDAPTREAALAVLALGAYLTDHRITLRQGGFHRDRDEIIQKTRTLLALGERLAAAGRIPVHERLAAIAGGDPLAPVRRNALDALLMREAQARAPQAVVDGAVKRALEDPDATIRLTAATSGRAGLAQSRQTLTAIAWSPEAADAIRARAFAALGTLDGVDRPDDLLDALLEGGSESRVAAIGMLGRRGCAASRVTPFATRADAATRAAVALALEQAGDPSAQPLLLTMAGDTDEAVRMAAIQALGAIADVGAVETLLPLMRGVFGGPLKQAAQQAVAKIQSRTTGAGAGQLSVSDAPAGAGALSTVAAEEGALSEPASGPRAAGRKAPA